jgi:hypothetical protein
MVAINGEMEKAPFAGLAVTGPAPHPVSMAITGARRAATSQSPRTPRTLQATGQGAFRRRLGSVFAAIGNPNWLNSPYGIGKLGFTSPDIKGNSLVQRAEEGFEPGFTEYVSFHGSGSDTFVPL